MNLRHLNNKEKNELPKWLSTYSKDRFDFNTQSIYVLDGSCSEIFELVAYLINNKKYLSYYGYRYDKSSTTLLVLDDYKLNSLIKEIVNESKKTDLMILNEIDTFLKESTEKDDIVFISKKPNYITVPYLFNKFNRK